MNEPLPSRDLPPARPERTRRVLRATLRLLRQQRWAGVPEMPVGDGRRVDLMAVDPRGRILVVEVKSCLEDFRADGKWPAYGAWCDLFAFAVPDDFPRERLPPEVGVVVSDGFEAAWWREPPERPLAPGRRRALLLHFARSAAFRLGRLLDPPAEGGILPASQLSIR